MPRITGVNAIMVAGELLGELSRLAAEMRTRAIPRGPFDPPYTTVHVGTHRRAARPRTSCLADARSPGKPG